jgi:4'-phosphopantetheinyl transferase EntD
MSAAVFWMAQTEAAVPADNGWLSERENRILGALRIPKRRAEWRLARWTAKLAVAARAGLPSDPEALAIIELRSATSGAPRAYIRSQPAGVAISLSHSHGIGFCTIAAVDTELGCDVELAAPHSQAFLTDYFTPEEQALLKQSAAARRATILTLLWSAKESMLKALECGLRRDPLFLRVIPETAGAATAAWRPLMVRDAHCIFHGWWRATGDSVWTVVANPPPARPAPLLACIGAVFQTET